MISDRFQVDVDPDAPETDFDNAIVEFLLRLVERDSTISTGASTADRSIGNEAA